MPLVVIVWTEEPAAGGRVWGVFPAGRAWGGRKTDRLKGELRWAAGTPLHLGGNGDLNQPLRNLVLPPYGRFLMSRRGVCVRKLSELLDGRERSIFYFLVFVSL